MTVRVITEFIRCQLTVTRLITVWLQQLLEMLCTTYVIFHLIHTYTQIYTSHHQQINSQVYWLGRRTCDQQIVSSTLGRALLGYYLDG